MKQHLNIEHEPAFHKIIIVSIVLHILFLSLVAVPTRTKERDNTNYIVKLVSPGETMSAPANTVSKIPSDSSEKRVKEKPEQEIKKERKLPLPEPVPEKHRNKTTTGSQITSPPALVRHSEKERLPSVREHEIKREFQETEGRSLRYTAAIERTYRGQSFEEAKTLGEEQIMIPDKNKPVFADRVPIERISRGTTFPSQEIARQQEGMIARGKIPSETERSVITGTSGFFNASDRIVQRKEEFKSSTLLKSSAMITKPDISGESEEREYNHGSQDERVVNGREGIGNSAPSHVDRLSSSAFSIQGVPLNDLHACSHALDERTLKTELLKILGSSRGCYSPATGTYVFLGTNRYSSFDMIISPAAGRELSNRCEELNNALNCLHSLKE